MTCYPETLGSPSTSLTYPLLASSGLGPGWQGILAVVAQQEANVVPDFSEAIVTIFLYTFAFGHVVSALMSDEAR